MKKRLIASLGVLVMGLLIGTSYAFAGPPGETSGIVTSDYYGDQIVFTAFELGPVKADRCRGKGSVDYTAERESHIYVYHFKVKYANVQPDDGLAWFAGICTDATDNGEDTDENVGMWMIFQVSDQGEGPANDGLSGQWESEQEAAEEDVCTKRTLHPGPLTAGDIVVQIHPPGQQKKK